MNRTWKFSLALLIHILFLLKVNAQSADIKSIGVPYVQNYSKSIYQSGNQNWSVTKDKSGVMYFANSEGLLVFDGRYWQLYNMPNHIIVRAVASDGHGRIYAGGFGEFGYWAYNQSGKFVYHSLSKLVSEKYELKDEIWKIYIDGKRVIFQSFASIFIYENGKINDPVKSSDPFLFLFKAKSRFFVEVLSKGLFELKGESLTRIRNSEVLGNTGILSVLPFGDNFLIGTAKNGLFLYDGDKIIPWENQANDFLKTYQLNNGALVLNHYFAFGTILNGVIILDQSGHVVQRINKSAGLQNNTVLSLYADNNQNLWVGLDNGIDRIELNSPLYFYFDKTGKVGTVYSSIIYRDKIYLGTNQGLFYSDFPLNKPRSFRYFDFKLIPDSQGQVWDLSLIDGQLFCGHNNGTYIVKGNTLKKISDINGGWTIKKLSSDPDLLIQGTYTGLVIYHKDVAGNWLYSHKITGFGEPSRYVEQDNRGHIWVTHAYKGVYKLTPDEGLHKIKSSRYYDQRDGLPGSYNINVFNLENHIVFSSDSGFYIYDDISDHFARYTPLNRRLGSFASSNKIIPAWGKRYWFINHGRVALADFSDPGKLYMDSTRFSILDGRMVQYYENISQISKHIYLISVDDGFAIFNENAAVYKKIRELLPEVLIRKVENTTGNVYTITEQARREPLEILYKQNNIRIYYALPYYRQAKIKYQYFLKGYSGQWSNWDTQTQKEFTNLGQGNYTFLVRAKVNGKYVSAASAFEFTVLPPWYATEWALICYLVILVAVFLLFRRVYFANLKKHQENIRIKLQKEKEEYLKQEAIANEQKIIKLKNEQLQADLMGKSRELANSAMNIVYKNELLQKIRDEIYQLKDANGKKLSEDQLKKIQKVIDEGMSDDRDWNLFEKSFNEAHENFFKKLKANHPDLVPNDLKLCAYLRMNMSSKEIASLLNISLRGVEIRRYRLRKKLNVEHDKNLAEFLLEL